MIYHILNGDALKDQFPTQEQISGETIIFRECLISGPIEATSINEFWKNRERFIQSAFSSEEDYATKVLAEFEKLKAIGKGDEVCLWFDEDLYCLVNLTFTVNLILSYSDTVSFYWIKPTSNNWWGYGGMSSEELVEAYIQKIPLSAIDISNLSQAWKAFQQKDFTNLTSLAAKLRHKFPQIEDVVHAHIDRFPAGGGFGRPEMTILHIIRSHPEWNFGQLFRAFIEKEGIYGFGDLQVKNMYQEVKRFHGIA